jgi:hypothetical protein
MENVCMYNGDDDEKMYIPREKKNFYLSLSRSQAGVGV